MSMKFYKIQIRFEEDEVATFRVMAEDPDGACGAAKNVVSQLVALGARVPTDRVHIISVREQTWT